MKKLFILILMLVHVVSFGNNDKYRLVLVSDPATTITIGWNQISGTNPTIYYGTTDFGTAWASYPNSKTVDRSVSSRGMNNQFARLSGLTPNTDYFFVIRDSQGTSQRLWFRTAPNDLSRLSFIAGGDSRNNRTPRQNANKIVAKLKPNAVFFGGDMTDNDSSASWQLWMDDWQLTTTSDGRMFPIVPAVGNHEGSTVIYELFDTPDNNSYYAMTFGDNLIRAYTLNTNISVSGNQLTWLENDLSVNLNTRWKTAQYHKPMRPHESGKSEGEAHYQAWADLFYDSGVRLVVDCDSHTVKTTWPVKPSSEAGNDEGFIREDVYGTVYAGEGCWGAPLRSNDDDKTWTRNSASFNQFKLIYVDNTKIELRTVEVDNWSSVPDLAHNDPFGLPDSNSYLWNPSEGMVVTIDHVDLPAKPEIAFEDGIYKDYIDGTNITLDIDVIDNGGGITQVEFFIDGLSQGTDNSSPFGFTNTYTDGAYHIEAIATNAGLLTGSTEININVGTFTIGNTISIADGNDDVEEAQTDGSVLFDSSDLEFFDDDFNGGWQKIGLRFQKINIPKGAIINSANIRFKSDASDSQSDMYFRIYIEDNGDARPFESNITDNVSARNKYATFVDWDVQSWSDGERGSATTSDDLAVLLQGIIDRCDWKQGNNIAFIFERTGPNANDASIERRADTYEQDPSEAAEFLFNYTYNTLAPVGVTKFISNAWTNGVPNSTSTVIIEDDYNTLVNGGSIDACNVIVNAGKTLTVAGGHYLNVDGDITIDGTLVIEHAGSIVQINDNALVTNNGTINVNLTTPSLNARDFMIMGSPMSGANNAMFTAYQVLNHTTANFTPYVGTPAVVGVNFHDQESNDWSNFTGVLAAGEGYLVRPSYTSGGAYNYVYDQGTLNNGVITYSNYYGDDKEDSPNIISNPYASAIDAATFINDNSVVDEVYFWEHLTTPAAGIPGPLNENFNMEDISTFNGTMGIPASNDPGTSTTPNGIISTGQGFAYKANAAGDVTFTNSMRLTSGNTTLRRPAPKDLIWLTVREGQYHMGSTAGIGFLENATAGLDQGYDSMKLGTVVSLYSHLEDGSEQLGIQGREAFNSEMSIPMGFSTLIEQDGGLPYVISISNLEGTNIEAATVYLIDHQEDVTTNLSEGNYTFLSRAGTFNNRFTLQFISPTLSVNNPELENISVYPNPVQNVVNIVSPNAVVTGIEVYDIRGRMVISEKINIRGSYQIDLSTFETAMYFLKVTTENGSITKRIVKK